MTEKNRTILGVVLYVVSYGLILLGFALQKKAIDNSIKKFDNELSEYDFLGEQIDHHIHI